MMPEEFNFKRHSIEASKRSKEADMVRVERIPIAARWLGSGGFATVAENALKVEKNEHEHIVHLALKNYKKYDSRKKGALEHEFAMYKVCKDAGLKVLPTYRVDTKEGIVAMTDFSKGGEYIVFSNLDNSSLQSEVKVKQIKNFESFWTALLNDARKADTNNIQLYYDVFLFRFLKGEEKINLEYVINDFNHVEVLRPREFRLPASMAANVHAATLAMKHWVKKFVVASEQQALFNKIEKMAQREA